MKKINYILVFLLILSIIGLVVMINILHNKNVDIKTYKNNITALSDSLVVTHSNYNTIIGQKTALLLESEKQLAEYTSMSESEINQLKKELNSKISYISSQQYEIDMLNDKIKELSGDITKDSVGYNINFSFEDKFRELAGYTYIISDSEPTSFKTFLTKDLIHLSLKTGITDDYRIFVETDNPYVKINNIEGAIVDKNLWSDKYKKRNNFSLNISVGYGTDFAKFHPFVGIGIGYNLINF